MKTLRLLAAVASLVAGASAQAHEFDPGGRIVLACSPDRSPSMADVAHAVGYSHYWAPQSARREILVLARQACENGSEQAVFVPSADQRFAAARAATANR